MTNIIEDPSSNYVTQTLAYLPLGYLVKTAKLTKESLKENECACFIALLNIYNLDMDLVVQNLSEGFTLEDFYKLRENYNCKYGPIIESASKYTGIGDFYKKTSEELLKDKCKIELEQLYKSESNLYYRLITEGTTFLNDDSYTRALQLVSQSRLEYPTNGIDACYVPQLSENCSQLTNSSEESLFECISSFINQDHSNFLDVIWNTTYIDWRDRVNELLMMSYVLSPHKIVKEKDEDILYAICQLIIDKSMLFSDDMTQFIDKIYGMFVKPIDDEDQIRILNRVNSIFISNYLEHDSISFLINIQDDIQWITNICLEIDKKAGRNANYKSRVGIGSSLDIFEKTNVDKILQRRQCTDTKRSRQNRYKNKIRYDYDVE